MRQSGITWATRKLGGIMEYNAGDSMSFWLGTSVNVYDRKRKPLERGIPLFA